MKCSVEVKMDNAAFQDNGDDELANILKLLSEQVRVGFTSGLLTDSNGNRVGFWKIEE